MGNPATLININDRSPEEAFAMRSKGGKNAAKTTRARKKLREELLALLAKGDTQERMSLAIIKEALDGNVKAFETVRDTIGEKPVERSQTEVKVNNGKLDNILSELLEDDDDKAIAEVQTTTKE